LGPEPLSIYVESYMTIVVIIFLCYLQSYKQTQTTRDSISEAAVTMAS